MRAQRKMEIRQHRTHPVRPAQRRQIFKSFLSACRPSASIYSTDGQILMRIIFWGFRTRAYTMYVCVRVVECGFIAGIARIHTILLLSSIVVRITNIRHALSEIRAVENDDLIRSKKNELGLTQKNHMTAK